MTFLSRFAVFAVAALPTTATAHEFWIEPGAYQVETGATMVAHLRVGENFGGIEQSYLPRNFERFDRRCGDMQSEVPGRAGDRPAMSMEAPGDGLCVIIHQTRDYSLTYREWQKFVNFVEHKDFEAVLDEHLSRGLPRDGFRERYSRFAKSLIAVGDGAGADIEAGMRTEIVAEANPYTDPLDDGFPVRVLFNGEPRADAQVELFAKSADGAVEITLHRTDMDGRVNLPVRPGMSYLADAVLLLPLSPQTDTAPVWESLWASLTFAVPE
ncbi:DUF4198 domain-containing protein [Marivita sp.]|uniref:DUF4198 domain-containing protein n=1 Tax=Marivita sp. TaxID=2003365 RepID=UPI0025C68804|nr:DUF4198 domain-containing protein [Marivita sp.]